MTNAKKEVLQKNKESNITESNKRPEATYQYDSKNRKIIFKGSSPDMPFGMSLKSHFATRRLEGGEGSEITSIQFTNMKLSEEEIEHIITNLPPNIKTVDFGAATLTEKV